MGLPSRQDPILAGDWGHGGDESQGCENRQCDPNPWVSSDVMVTERPPLSTRMALRRQNS